MHRGTGGRINGVKKSLTVTRLCVGKLRKVALAVALLAGAGGIVNGTGTIADSASLGAPSRVTHAAQQGPYFIVVVMDAARFDELDLSKLPNIRNLVQGGTQYSRAWVGSLPSITETSHASIGTGVLPSRHLILGDTWRVPGKNQMAPSLLNGNLTRTGYIGKLIQQSGSPSLAGLIHKSRPGSIVVSLSGHKIYAADAMGAGTADYVAFGGLDKRKHYVPGAIPGHVPSQTIMTSGQLDLPSYPRKPGLEDWWATTLAEKFLFKYHPRVIMMNLPEVDVAGHAAGTNATVMQPLMSNIDKQVGRLVAAYGRAHILDQTYFILTADHAMVPAIHTVSQDLVRQVIEKAGGHQLYIGHGDYCPIYLSDLSAVPRVAVALATSNLPDVVAVYQKGINGQYWLVSNASRLAIPTVNQSYLDLLSSFNSPESPDIILVYNENTMTMTPLYQKISRKGDHGGATWGAQHIPLIISGPGIKKAYVSDYPARLVDIAPTIESLMGIQPQGQDGVPLADAMTNPAPWAKDAQDKAASRLTQDVSALQSEAAIRPNLH